MQRDLEDVSASYHGALAALHGFAALFFVQRAIREYNDFRPYGRLVKWGAFHATSCIVSLIASRTHARDARQSERRS